MTNDGIAVLIGLILWLMAFTALIVFCLYYEHKVDKAKEEYLNTLNDHEKAIILKYRHIKPKWRWRKGNK